jgi:hypothetical protein
MFDQFHDLCTSEAHARCARNCSSSNKDTGEKREICPRFDFGKYLMSCAQKYSGDIDEEEITEEEEEEANQEMLQRVRALLLTDWELGCSWFHGTDSGTDSYDLAVKNYE